MASCLLARLLNTQTLKNKEIIFTYGPPWNNTIPPVCDQHFHRIQNKSSIKALKQVPKLLLLLLTLRLHVLPQSAKLSKQGSWSLFSEHSGVQRLPKIFKCKMSIVHPPPEHGGKFPQLQSIPSSAHSTVLMLSSAGLISQSCTGKDSSNGNWHKKTKKQIQTDASEITLTVWGKEMNTHFFWTT